jgi:hypothetical protein
MSASAVGFGSLHGFDLLDAGFCICADESTEVSLQNQFQEYFQFKANSG